MAVGHGTLMTPSQNIAPKVRLGSVATRSRTASSFRIPDGGVRKEETGGACLANR